jgi:galactose mutarotase-like enzyme
VPDRSLATVLLRDERAEIEATFVPGAGMLCCSLCHCGEELLAQNDGVDAYAERGKTMGIPLLYPWANRLAAFDYTVGGRTIGVPHDPSRVALDTNGLPIHGVIGGRLAWELVRVPTPGNESLSARLGWDDSEPARFEVFPFRHEIHYDARLVGGSLELELTVRASGPDAVPLAFGFHPYLSLPGSPRERWLVELPPMRRLALDRNQIPTGPQEALPSQTFELAEHEFDDGFDRVTEPAPFAVADARRRIELEFLEGYPCAQVFAPRSGQFICFEPMRAPTNALRSGVGLRLLAPGESYGATFAVRPTVTLSPMR